MDKENISGKELADCLNKVQTLMIDFINGKTLGEKRIIFILGSVLTTINSNFDKGMSLGDRKDVLRDYFADAMTITFNAHVKAQAKEEKK